MPTLRRLLITAVAALPCWAGAFSLSGAVVTTDQVRAELLVHAPEGVATGKPLWLGLAIDHAPHWHTYWKNPGDSGLPTTLQWTLPPGFEAGAIEWPTPRRLPVGPLTNFGHEGRLLLPVRVEVPAGYAAPTLDVRLRADWLVCKDVCIPEGGDFVLSVPAQAATAAHAARFEAAWAQRPQPVDAAAAARVDDGALVVDVVGLPPALHARELHFFPELPGVIDNAAHTPQRWSGDDWQVRVPLSAQRSESPQRMVAVLAAADGGPGVQITFGVAGPWPAPGSVPAAAAAPTTAPPPPAPAAMAPAATPGLLLALVLAAAGGLLLNLMPCVFPVLSLKVIGFAAHAHERRALLAGGIAYTAGVVLSFVGLAALLLALRAGGEQIGWGFQLQSPAFVATLAVLFTLIGLNLAGVYAFGSLLPGNLAALRARHPLADALLTGVLAVAVASPCTAPFMGAALGAAATLPSAQALAVFAALGLGMALPYLAASAWPALARALPRPGAWMLRFKTLMAFPMFATVVWLLWVLGQQVGIDGAAALLGLLVAVAFATWALGTPGMGRAGRAGFGAVALTVLAGTAAWVWPSLREAPPPPHAAAGERWQPWSVERVAQAHAQGRPVFVDFTAAWCVTCQFNKRAVLNDAVLLADFELHKVVLLRADWTRRDAAITAELARLGRNGVPVYAFYRPGAATPQLLSELLTVQEVRSAIAATSAVAQGPGRM